MEVGFRLVEVGDSPVDGVPPRLPPLPSELPCCAAAGLLPEPSGAASWGTHPVEGDEPVPGAEGSAGTAGASSASAPDGAAKSGAIAKMSTESTSQRISGRIF